MKSMTDQLDTYYLDTYHDELEELIKEVKDLTLRAKLETAHFKVMQEAERIINIGYEFGEAMETIKKEIEYHE